MDKTRSTFAVRHFPPDNWLPWRPLWSAISDSLYSSSFAISTSCRCLIVLLVSVYYTSWPRPLLRSFLPQTDVNLTHLFLSLPSSLPCHLSSNLIFRSFDDRAAETESSAECEFRTSKCGEGVGQVEHQRTPSSTWKRLWTESEASQQNLFQSTNQWQQRAPRPQPTAPQRRSSSNVFQDLPILQKLQEQHQPHQQPLLQEKREFSELSHKPNIFFQHVTSPVDWKSSLAVLQLHLDFLEVLETLEWGTRRTTLIWMRSLRVPDQCEFWLLCASNCL